MDELNALMKKVFREGMEQHLDCCKNKCDGTSDSVLVGGWRYSAEGHSRQPGSREKVDQVKVLQNLEVHDPPASFRCNKF